MPEPRDPSEPFELPEVSERPNEPRPARRLPPIVLLLPAALLAVGIVAALTMDDDDDATPAAARSTTTRPLSTSTTARPTTTTALDPTTTSAGATATTTGPTGTTAPPTTEAPAGTTSTTQAASRCGADAFSVETATDKGVYGRGEEVKFTSTVTNRSSAPCAVPSYTFVWNVDSEAGATVAEQVTIRSGTIRQPLKPGERYTVTPTWDALVCLPSGACAPAAPGTYTVVARWRISSPPPGESTATFRVEA